MVTSIHRYSANVQIGNFLRVLYDPVAEPLDPISTTDTAYHVLMVWAFPRSLAATDGIENFFLFLEVMRCFSSLG